MREPLGMNGLKGAAAAVGELTLRSEPRGRKARPITDIKSTVLRKEEMVVRLWTIREEQP
jgi:hypothetical protein